MKKLLLILLCLPLLTLAQQTYVPDDNFEAYLEANGMGNFMANDDYVTTANINTVTNLNIPSLAITDLTGIEDFTALTELMCSSNPLTSLDVTQNLALRNFNCRDNQLTSLDVSQNTALTQLRCSSNQLTSLDITQNTALNSLFCDDNQLTSLDVSQNTSLTFLLCYSNQLTSLDSRNGNNQNTWNFGASNNPLLTCINVDDVSYSTTNWTDIDTQHYFSTNCPPPSAIQEHSSNKELLKVTDLLGRETKQTNQPLIYIYDDATVEKKITID